MTSSKTLFYLCISFVAGILLASLIKIPHIFLWGFLILGALAIFISIFFHKNYYALIGFCMLFLILGSARLQISEFNVLHNTLSKLIDTPEKITLIGNIIEEPDVRDKMQKLKVHPVKFAIGNVPSSAEQFNWVKINEFESVVLVTLSPYPEYYYLDTIKITGKLKTPITLEDFNYKNYLMKEGVYSIMDFPKTELITKNHSNDVFSFLYEKILFFKKELKESIYINFAPPQSFIVEGIMLGNDKNMNKDLKDKMSATGLSHLTAISGSNIIILSSIMMAFLLFLGFWRGQAFYFSIIFIWLYILIAGFPASGIRAGIMGSIFLLSSKLGRQNTSSRVIVLAGALMLLQNPFLLLYDVGFQLSFLASMGIIYLKPIIDNFIFFIPFLGKKIGSDELNTIPKAKFFLDIFSITISAQIFTLPLIAYHFKNVSLVAPLTNLLIIPIVDWIMIFGFLAAILGIFSGILGFIFSIPCYFLLEYFLKIVDIFYQPWAVLTMKNISWIWLPIYYIVLVLLVRYLEKVQKPKFLGY